PAENLPPVLDALHGQRGGVVIRAVNDIDAANKATVSLDPRVAPPGSTVIETDLIERALPRSAEPRFSVEKSADGRLAVQLDFKPHEIRTFKIFKE
ncbi:MAG: hypothetical protein JW839_06665, partial [Candidatus Lokiarchaeota archaeon]|nr:hypothetical protein [Candidatus Lokiarchaeota archaeon]